LLKHPKRPAARGVRGPLFASHCSVWSRRERFSEALRQVNAESRADENELLDAAPRRTKRRQNLAPNKKPAEMGPTLFVRFHRRHQTDPLPEKEQELSTLHFRHVQPEPGKGAQPARPENMGFRSVHSPAAQANRSSRFPTKHATRLYSEVNLYRCRSGGAKRSLRTRGAPAFHANNR